MLWLVWVVVWFLYCLRLVPTWAFVYCGLRPGRRRIVAWAYASVAATFWPLWLWQFRRWQRGQRAMSDVDRLEQWLHQHH